MTRRDWALARSSRPPAGRARWRPPNLRPASGGLITRITHAGIVELAVPTAAPPPAAPGYVIAIPAVGISRFPCRAIDALGVVAWTRDYLPGHCGRRCQCKRCGSAENSEFHHAFLDSVAVR